MRRGMATVIVIVYLVIGLVVAQTNDYLKGLGNLKPIVSAVLAIILWPLILVGVDIRFK